MKVYSTENGQYPKEGERVLVQNKHVWIEATYSPEGEGSDIRHLFSTYMWNSLEFYGYRWIRLEDFNKELY